MPSSSMISLHRRIQSLQMSMPGPAINLSTCLWDLPQNVQLPKSLLTPNFVTPLPLPVAIIIRVLVS